MILARRRVGISGGKRGYLMLIRRSFYVSILVLFFSSLTQAQTPAEWKPVEDAMGRSGKLQPDGAFKFSMPRKDLKVIVAGTPVKPGLALGSWAAFSGSGDTAMVMGDLVLTDD